MAMSRACRTNDRSLTRAPNRKRSKTTLLLAPVNFARPAQFQVGLGDAGNHRWFPRQNLQALRDLAVSASEMRMVPVFCAPRPMRPRNWVIAPNQKIRRSDEHHGMFVTSTPDLDERGGEQDVDAVRTEMAITALFSAALIRPCKPTRNGARSSFRAVSNSLVTAFKPSAFSRRADKPIRLPSAAALLRIPQTLRQLRLTCGQEFQQRRDRAAVHQIVEEIEIARRA